MSRGPRVPTASDTIARAVAGCHTVYERPHKPAWPNRAKGKQAARPSANGNGHHGLPPPPNGEQPAADPSEEDDGIEDTGYGIILAYFRRHYSPVFRRGMVLYSGALGREVKTGEACSAPGIALAKLLMQAMDAPGKGGFVDPNDMPPFFRTWAPSAWKDLLDTLPDEEASAEVICSAEEEFHGRVAKALLHHAALGKAKEGSDGEDVRIQRRTLLNWCRLFAKNGAWRDVRGYQVWCRKDSEGRLQVALRKGLFGQVQGCADLERLTATKFTRLCEVYAVGEGERVKGSRAVVLSAEFLAWLEGQPAADDSSGDRGETHAGAREDEVSKCHDDDEPPPGQGFSDDTSCDTSSADAQSVTQSVTELPF